MIPAFGYLRVSDPSQLAGDGFTRQRAAIEAFASANGYRVVQWFEERGVSGKTEWESRPAWVDMVSSLNGTKAIIIEKLDRLARLLGVQENIISDLERRRITLLSAGEPDLGSDDPARVLVRQMFGAVAQYDRAMLTAKMKAAKARMRAAGVRCEGRKPYGMDSPDETATLALMRELRASGDSYESVANALTATGYRTRYGKPWIGASVCKILRRA